MKNLIALASALALSSVASAFPKYAQNFEGHYKTSGVVVDDLLAKESCGLCHNRATGGGARNAYGQDFDAIALGKSEGFPGVEFLDSDGDTFLNLEEIFLQTAPGKKDDAPKGRIELKFDTASGNLTAKVTAACTKLELKSFGVNFAGKQDVSFDNVAAEQVVAISGTAGAVIAKCVTEGFTGSVVLK
jgi:hypothetical protein